jgi:hypothetical protein
MIADLARSGMAVQNAISARAAPGNLGDLQLVKLSGNHRRFSNKDEVIILKL